MKILPRYLPGLSIKQAWFSFILILCPTILSAAESLKSQVVPGIVENLELLIRSDQQRVQKQTEALRTNPLRFKISPTENDSSFKISQFFLTHLIFQLKLDFYDLVENDPCVIINQLRLKYPGVSSKDPTYKEVILENKDGKKSLMNIREYTNFLLSGQCTHQLATIKKYQSSELKKTFKNLKLPVPNNTNQCQEQINKFTHSADTIYYCYFVQKLNQNKKYLKKLKSTDPKILKKAKQKVAEYQKIRSFIGPANLSYFRNICQNYNNQKQYCDFFFQKSFFHQFVNQSDENFYFEKQCQDVLNTNSKLNYSLIRECSQIFKSDASKCWGLNKNYPSLIPNQSCTKIEVAYKNTRLGHHIKDCPGNIPNEGITNISRIHQYFSKEKDASIENSNCSAVSSYPFIKLAIEQVRESAWNVKVCYQDRLKVKKTCKHTMYTADNTYTMAISNIVKDILVKTRGMDQSQECQLIPEEKYNPVFLKYKSGCFLLFKPNQCYISKCPLKVILNERNINNLISHESDISYFYIHSKNRLEHLSFLSLVKKELKLKEQLVTNFSELKKILKNKKKVLVHGLGCLEDILPHFYRRNSYQSCQPLPFIIENIVPSKKEKLDVVVRLSIDESQFPRIIAWNNIYYSILNYQQIHPSKRWTLNAVYNQ